MQLFDCHTHAFLPEDLKVLNQRLTALDARLSDDDPNKWQLYGPGDAAGLAAQQKAAEVERWVHLPITGRAERVGELNRAAAKLARENHRVTAFGVLHPAGRPEHDLAELVDLELKGVKLHPFIQRLSLDDPALMGLLAGVAEAGLPVLADSMSVPGLLSAKPHLEWAVNLMSPGSLEPRFLAAAAAKNPGIKLIAAHGGCLYGWDQTGPLLELPQVHFDLAYLVGLLDSRETMRIIQKRGVERVLYGSDCPWRSALASRAWFEDLPLSNWEREMIGAGNLLRLLGEN